jgi:hypothetical protein
MATKYQFKGTDYSEIELAINGKLNDEMDNDESIKQFIKEENIDLLRDFLIAHINHNETCEAGRTEDNGVFRELAKIEDPFTFLNIYYALVPLMWC